LAVLATAGTAFAQSTVTLSGGIGTQYSRTTVANNKASLNNADAGSTNFALSATEDLGGGLKATVYMQQRFNSVTGANGNSPLTTSGTDYRGVQNINVGLSGAFGTVNIGRIATGSLSGFDAFGGYNEGYAYANKGSARLDRTILYTSPTISGFSVNVATTNTTGTLKEYSYVRATYTNGPLSLGVLSDEIGGVASGTTAGGLAGDKNLSIGGSYDLGMAKVLVLNGKNTPLGGTSTSNTSIGVQVPMGAMTFKASFRSGDANNQSAVGVDYALSKRTGLYAAAVSDSGTVAVPTQSAFRLGITHSF